MNQTIQITKKIVENLKNLNSHLAIISQNFSLFFIVRVVFHASRI